METLTVVREDVSRPVCGDAFWSPGALTTFRDGQRLLRVDVLHVDSGVTGCVAFALVVSSLFSKLHLIREFGCVRDALTVRKIGDTEWPMPSARLENNRLARNTCSSCLPFGYGITTGLVNER